MRYVIYLNQTYVNVDEATFEALLPGNIEGEGAFETMRLYKGKIFAYKEHMLRLKRGLKHFHQTLPLSEQRISRIIEEVSRKNKLPDARVRVIIWRFQKNGFISISCEPLKLASVQKYKTGYKVMTARYERKRNYHSDVKSIDYRRLRQISKEAASKGFDEALLINSKGEIVEGTRTNIFFVKNRILYTPSLRCGCLNGITRQKVIACARGLRIPVRTVSVKLSQLILADEAFLTGSTLEVMPVQGVDRKPIGKRNSRKLTTMIQARYRSLVRRSLGKER